MQKTGFNWKTTDNLTIQANYWPVDDARAVICIVHGLGEHIGRYDEVAAFFNTKNFAAVAADRRGHGRSEGKKGHTTHFEAFMEEIATLIEKARELNPGRPLFLYGHSMGGNLVLNYVLRKRPIIQGVVATGSWVRLEKPPSKLLLGFAKMTNSIFPAFSQSNGLKTSELSSDPEVVAAYEADPLVHDRITVATALSMLDAASWLDQYSGETPVPALIMHGGIDKITDPAGSEYLAKRLKGDVTWKPWGGLKHEIHNEPAKEEVLSFLVKWVEKHI
jgi:alpha-beta hydrolase superfamily lysophospholipase